VNVELVAEVNPVEVDLRV